MFPSHIAESCFFFAIGWPVRYSFRTLKVSTMGVRMPWIVPNMLPSPRLTNIRKNITDQKGEAGKWVMASVKAMKAKPVPCTACERKDKGRILACLQKHEHINKKTSVRLGLTCIMAACFAQANITCIFLRKSKIYLIIFFFFNVKILILDYCYSDNVHTSVYSVLLKCCSLLEASAWIIQHVLVWGFMSKQAETYKNRFG